MKGNFNSYRRCILLVILLCSATVAQAEWFTNSGNIAARAPFYNKGYQQLNRALDYYQNLVAEPWPELLNVPHNSPNFLAFRAALIKRLQLLGDLAHDISHEDIEHDLVAAVRQFQWRHGLKPDAIIDANTIDALNIPPSQRVAEIKRNMAHWAELPEDLGQRFVLINIPAYRLLVIDNDQEVMQMRVIVGRISRQTPELISTITKVVLNPYWYVPPSLFRRDILPKLVHDPDYLQRAHIKVFGRFADQLIEQDPQTINWHKVARQQLNYTLRQSPGEHNSLGLLKFIFANNHNIYMHDSPAKELFMQKQRLFSSGCIRLQQPFMLLAYLLSDQPQWQWDKIANIIATAKSQAIAIKPIPIYVMYDTTWFDHFGLLHFSPDPYRYNDDFLVKPQQVVGMSIIPGLMPLEFYV
jgi:murein L,D-transpeptidase YcbB/YkuD